MVGVSLVFLLACGIGLLAVIMLIAVLLGRR